MRTCLACALALVLLGATRTKARDTSHGRPAVVLGNEKAQLVVDLAGGALADFHLKALDLNPFNWGTPGPNDKSIRGFGHFLCLDRWGPASAAEEKRGMPYHGEASNVEWKVEDPSAVQDGTSQAQISARLPLAGLAVRRTISLSGKSAVALVQEEITNENALGRIYNMVQHPTIAPPFLDETTVVDCNGRQGFAQGGSLPDPEQPSCYWPKALNRDGNTVNLRMLSDDPNPNVVSYAIDESYGWVTAATARKGLLVGYIWKTSDYPWVSLWRDVHDGKPAARGLEFGTTGLHQPYPILVQKGRIWGRPLFEHLDSSQTVRKRFTMFLLEIPSNFAGVETVTIDGPNLKVRERREPQPRELVLEAGGFLP